MSGMCPGCGESNLCAFSLGKPAEQCWCMTRAVDRKNANKTKELKLSVPEKTAECYCQSCLEKLKRARQESSSELFFDATLSSSYAGSADS